MKKIALFTLALLSAFAVSTRAQDAKSILDASGVQGGLVVHLGCGDGRLTAALRATDSYTVHGLDADESNVAAARRHVESLGLYGPVSVDLLRGNRLPYTDNMVNLLVVSEPGDVPTSELMRVLCPGGVALTKKGKRIVKPWPDEIDEWTHFHHDPQGTMVGHDQTTGPPRRIQWMAGPKWLRNHDFMSSLHAMVTSGGRVFYVIDEGLRNHIFLPARWTLVARDAFNGTILWKKPLADWHPNIWPLKSGPGHYPRKLVAVGDRVYVAAGLTDPVVALDAATGKTLTTYKGTKPTQEIVLADGVLYLLVDPKRPPVNFTAEATSYKEIGRANSNWAWSTEDPERTIMAVEARSGNVLWEHTAKVAPLTLTVGGGKVFYHNGQGLVAVERGLGTPQWVTEGPSVDNVVTGGSLRLVFADGVVLFATGTKLTAFSAADGAQLWNGTLMKTSHHCPEDLFVIGDVIWSVNTGKPQENGTHFKTMNLRTGEVERDFVAENLPGFPMHPRCYPSKATTKFIMTNGMGTEFYRVGGDKVDINNAVRGSCIYGIMPANGLLYKPPDTCACYYQSKLEFLCALAPEKSEGEKGRGGEGEIEVSRLERGPAYDPTASGLQPTASAASWPMYRGDAGRSGFNPGSVSPKLKAAWDVSLGGKLTQPVVVDGRVFVAAVDRHALYALDAETGKTLWHYTAGGRIDSAPTVYGETVLFGSADGWVYCLNATSGELAWRYLVALDQLKIVSHEQVESAWPVSGSVVINDGSVWCLAGRNMFFDGGLRLVKLNPASGELISETVLDENDPRTGKNLQTLITQKYMPVANADLLSCDGKYLYLQAQKFDLANGRRLGIGPEERLEDGTRHLFCQTGFLDDAWYHRSYWLFGEDCGEGWGAYANPRDSVPCGRIMVLDDARAYAFRSDPLGNMLHPRSSYTLYAVDQYPAGGAVEQPVRRKRQKSADGDTSLGGSTVHWQLNSVPLLANAMTLADKSLFIAGPPDVADETQMFGFLPGADDDINQSLQEQEAAWFGKKGGILWAVSATDGSKLAEYQLKSYPVFDGMSAAGGDLYLSQIDGTVVKYEGN